jgi:hypothetical protein
MDHSFHNLWNGINDIQTIDVVAGYFNSKTFLEEHFEPKKIFLSDWIEGSQNILKHSLFLRQFIKKIPAKNVHKKTARWKNIEYN